MSRRIPAAGTAAATAAVVAFFVAAVLPRAAAPLTDPDVWWHIRAGQAVLGGLGVPDTDTWSIAGAGRPWTSQDWLANVVLALGENAGPWGRTALSLLFGVLTVLAFFILWRAITLRHPAVGWASRIVFLSIGLVLAGPVLGVRVQVLDLLLATAVIWLLWRYLVDPRRRWLVMLPVVAVLWANLHAGWLLLFLLGGAVLVGEAVDRLTGRRLAGAAPLDWHQLAELAAALVVSAGALVLNPNGIELYGYPFYTVGITALNRYVQEWYPASLDNLFGWFLLGFVLLVGIPTLVFGRNRLRTADALVLVGLTVMAWQAIRFLLIVGPIGTAVGAAVLAPVVSQTVLGRRLSPILARLARPRTGRLGTTNAILVGLVVVLGLAVTLARINPGAQPRAIAERMPVHAVEWMDEHNPGDRIFNRYEWGGYIGQHRPGEPIFIDGRADVYGNEVLETYVSVIGLRDDPQVVLDRYRIDHAVLPPEWELAAWFDASDAWQRVYSDDVAAIWVRQ